MILSLAATPSHFQKNQYDSLKLDIVKILQAQQFPSSYYISQKADCNPCRRLTALPRVKPWERRVHCHPPQDRRSASPVQPTHKMRGLCVKAELGSQRASAGHCWAGLLPARSAYWVCLSTEKTLTSILEQESTNTAE